MVSLRGCVIFVGNLDIFDLIVTSCKLLKEQINQKCHCLKHKIRDGKMYPIRGYPARPDPIVSGFIRPV